jgi:hypothetical protein
MADKDTDGRITFQQTLNAESEVVDWILWLKDIEKAHV